MKNYKVSTAPGIYLAHALLGNHGLVEMSGQFRTLALCCYVSSRIASACARKTRLPDAGSRWQLTSSNCASSNNKTLSLLFLSRLYSFLLTIFQEARSSLRIIKDM